MGKGKIKFEHQVIQEFVRFLAMVFFLGHRLVRSQGKPLADGETGFHDAVPREAEPARDHQAVELPVVLAFQVFDRLPFQFEIDPIKEIPDFCSGRDRGKLEVVVQFRLEDGRLGQCAVREHGPVQGDMVIQRNKPLACQWYEQWLCQ